MDAAGFGPLHWLLWRVVVSRDVPDGLHTIKTCWTIADLVEAHVMLDALAELTPPPPKP